MKKSKIVTANNKVTAEATTDPEVLKTRISSGKSAKQAFSINIYNAVPKAQMIGVGDKQTRFYKALVAKLEAKDETFIDMLCQFQVELVTRYELNYNCSCGCNGKHAAAMAAFHKEFYDAIDVAYRDSKHFMQTLGSSKMTLADAPMSLAEKNQILDLIRQDQEKQAAVAKTN